MSRMQGLPPLAAEASDLARAVQANTLTVLGTVVILILAFAAMWWLDVRRDRRLGAWDANVPRDLTAYRARRDALRAHERGPAA